MELPVGGGSLGWEFENLEIWKFENLKMELLVGRMKHGWNLEFGI